MYKTLFVCSTFVLGVSLSGCTSLGGRYWNSCPKVESSNMDSNGYLIIKIGVTKKCQIMRVDLGVEPISVVDEKDGTEIDLYPGGVFFQYDKQGTLIKYNLKKKSPN